MFLIAMNFAGPADPNSATYGVGCRISNVINTFNITPVLNGTIYNTTNLANNEIRIDKLIPTIPVNPSFTMVKFDIPSTINGRTVTEIGGTAFADQSNITSYTLPANLKTIGNSAFSNNIKLSQISIPASVRDINSGAFQGCTSLQTVTFLGTSQLQTIGSSAFSGCTNLSQISIPASVSNLNSGAFQNCTKLRTVTFSGTSQLQTIGTNAFANCTALSQISIPSSVTKIGDSAFNNCTGLTSITLSPSRIVYMGRYVFTGCNNLSITVQGASVGLKWKSDWDGNRPVTFTESGGCGIFHFTRYIATNVYYHTVSCKYCSDTLIESHTWIKYPTYYQCSDCQMTSVNIPIMIDNLPLLEYLLVEAEENDGYVCLHIDDGIELWYVDGQFFIVLDYKRFCEIQAELNTITDWFYMNLEQINSALSNAPH